MNNQQKKEFIEVIYNITLNSFESSQMSYEISNEQKNKTKIILYFFLNICISFENNLKNSSSSSLSTTSESNGKTNKSSKSTKTQSTKTQDFNWIEWRGVCLEFIKKYLLSDQSKLWSMSLIQENFLMLIWKYIFLLLEEKPVGISGIGKIETSLRKLCIDILSICMKQLDSRALQQSPDSISSFITSIIDTLCRYEHMGIHIAEIFSNCKNGSTVCQEIMKEIGRINMNDFSKNNANGVKNIGGFITNIGEISPETIITYLPLILNHLDSEAYQIR